MSENNNRICDDTYISCNSIKIYEFLIVNYVPFNLFDFALVTEILYFTGLKWIFLSFFTVN